MDTALFLNIAQSLAVFNIEKPYDADGNTIEPDIRWEPGVVSHPAPYKAKVMPRSAEHEKFIRTLEIKYPWQESDAETLSRVNY